MCHNLFCWNDTLKLSLSLSFIFYSIKVTFKVAILLVKIRYNVLINIYKITMKGKIYFYVALATSILIGLLHFFLHSLRVLDMQTSIFYMDEKVTLAAYFTTIMAFLVGLTHIEQIKSLKKSFNSITLGITGVIFMLFSLDEFFEIHEYANTLVKMLFSEESFVGEISRVTWVVPLGGIILIVFLILFLRLYLEKNKISKIAYVVGSMFFVGVLMLEFLEAPKYGTSIYFTMVGFEETFEMLAMSMFLLAAKNIKTSE